MRLYYRFARICCQAFFVLYFRGRVFGVRNVPASGPVLLACNHQSFFDPVSSALALHREVSFMARDTLFAHPLFKRLIESLNAFPVRRGAADIAAVKEMLRRLKQGRILVVFPEATRTRDGRIGEINANSLAVAKKAGAAIVPTIIDGAFEAWPRTQPVPSPWPIHVSYAEAVTAKQVEEWPIERIAEVVAARLHETFEASQRRRGVARSAGETGRTIVPATP